MGTNAAAQIQRLCGDDQVVEARRSLHRLNIQQGATRSAHLPLSLLSRGRLSRDHEPRRPPANSPAGIAVLITSPGDSGLLGNCLQSIAFQTQQPVEVRIAGDGSGNDRSRINQTGRWPFDIQVLGQNYDQLVDARNAAITALSDDECHALGVALLSDDIQLMPTYIEVCDSILKSYPEVGLISCWSADSKAGKSGWVRPCPSFPYQWTSNDAAPFSVVRTEALREVGSFRSVLSSGYDQWDFVNAVLAGGWVAITVPEILVQHPVRRTPVAQLANCDRTTRSELLGRFPDLVARDGQEIMRLALSNSATPGRAGRSGAIVCRAPKSCFVIRDRRRGRSMEGCGTKLCALPMNSPITNPEDQRTVMTDRLSARLPMNPLKIALLSYEYPPETGFGGIGTYTWYQARALAKLGHDVHVLAGATQATQLATTEHDGVKVFRFRGDGFLMRSAGRLEKFRLWWTKNRLENALSMYHGLRLLRRQHEYDLVEMPECGAEGMLITNLLRLPALIKFHSPSRLIMCFYDVRKSDIRFCSFFEQLGIRGADAFSSCSRFLADKAQEQLGVRLPIRVIPNGIDLELFDREEQVDCRGKFNIPKNQPVIFFSGRMERRKGIHLCKEIVTSILERFEATFVFAGQDLFNYMQDTLLPLLAVEELEGFGPLSGEAKSRRGAFLAAAGRHFSAPQPLGKLPVFLPGSDGSWLRHCRYRSGWGARADSRRSQWSAGPLRRHGIIHFLSRTLAGR